jgi:ABC-type glycerol-3-phosphate transport system permease component
MAWSLFRVPEIIDPPAEDRHGFPAVGAPSPSSARSSRAAQRIAGGGVLTSIPPVIVYVLAQRLVVKGLAVGGVKG